MLRDKEGTEKTPGKVDCTDFFEVKGLTYKAWLNELDEKLRGNGVDTDKVPDYKWHILWKEGMSTTVCAGQFLVEMWRQKLEVWRENSKDSGRKVY